MTDSTEPTVTPSIVTSVDPDGREVVGVRLSNHPGRAWLYAEDHVRFLEAIGPVPWMVNAGSKGTAYVRFRFPTDSRHGHLAGTMGTVARFITEAGLKTAVVYADGDRLNLRTANLRIGHGRGGLRTRSGPPKGGSWTEQAEYWKQRGAAAAARADEEGSLAGHCLPPHSGPWSLRNRRLRGRR